MSDALSSPAVYELVKSGVKLTPMMEQYFKIKENYKDMILLFRMGDFYEVFFDDAKDASRILNIALTHRGKLDGHPIPMAGIPHHAASNYIDKITANGMKAAICEQVEDPKMAEGIVKRAVTQVVSPSMPYDLEKIQAKDNKFIASGFYNNSIYSLSLLDFTTGDFFGLNTKDEEDFIEQLRLYAPQEFIAHLGQFDQHKKINDYIQSERLLLTNICQEYFDEKISHEYIKKLIPAYKRDEILKQNPNIVSIIGAISYYVCSTQSLEKVDHIKQFKLHNNEDFLKVTYPTLVGLEIFPKSREFYKDSLLGHVDKTKTSMGSRLLKQFFLRPLKSSEQINKRFDAIEYFMQELEGIKELRDDLTMIRDIDRIMAKVSTGKANGADLLNLATAIDFAIKSLDNHKKLPKGFLPQLANQKLSSLKELSTHIFNTINDEIGAKLDKGNLIKPKASRQRDKLAKVAFHASEAILELEQKFRKQTGIGNLKVKSNNVAGYFIEVSKMHTNKVPEEFKRRQTLVNCERYTNPALNDLESDIVNAKDKLLKLERKIFEDIIMQTTGLISSICEVTQIIATLDVFQGFAWLTMQEELTRPEIISDRKILNIKGAFHPLIKKSIKDQFVAHDLLLDEHQYFGLITGPNMAGKTTVMREMAIIQLLAQIGCFVPAESTQLSLCDYIFSRLGASDDIIKGQSTFMVEMTETAEIIRHATEDSLIILDEIGRGTSTFDGMSIAWSLVEYFVQETKAKTLFSTHYHELIDLVEVLPPAKNLTVRTQKVKNTVQFLYELIEEGATQSFGINVAALAGIPKKILRRSNQILSKIEKSNHSEKIINHIQAKEMDLDQMDLFDGSTQPAEVPKHLLEIEEELENLDVFNMTPIQAINKLSDMQKILNQ
jgi:DNA mismatch repair protein MutS